MITFKDFIHESINDKGILKAIFVVGIPGAGKSYTVSQLQGTVSPKVVNTDSATEYLSRKFNKPANSENWPFFRDKSKHITGSRVANYLNSMLPLFVDGTSNDTSKINKRVGILKSIGYDVGMVFINTDIEVAKERAVSRALDINRTVDPAFIEKVHAESEQNKEYFKGEFKFFKEVSNNPGELDDAAILKIYRSVAGFYESPVTNPVGVRALEKLREAKSGYLVPTIFDKAHLEKEVTGWFN